MFYYVRQLFEKDQSASHARVGGIKEKAFGYVSLVTSSIKSQFCLLNFEKCS